MRTENIKDNIKKLTFIFSAFVIIGCAKPTIYHHPDFDSDANEARIQFKIDNGECIAISYQSMPERQANETNIKLSNPNYYWSSNAYKHSNLEGANHYNNFNNRGASVAENYQKSMSQNNYKNARYAIKESCLLKRGWRRKKN